MLLEAEETVCPRRASARGSEKRRRSIGALLDTLLQLYMSLHSYPELRGGALPPLHPPVDIPTQNMWVWDICVVDLS